MLPSNHHLVLKAEERETVHIVPLLGRTYFFPPLAVIYNALAGCWFIVRDLQTTTSWRPK